MQTAILQYLEEFRTHFRHLMPIFMLKNYRYIPDLDQLESRSGIIIFLHGFRPGSCLFFAMLTMLIKCPGGYRNLTKKFPGILQFLI